MDEEEYRRREMILGPEETARVQAARERGAAEADRARLLTKGEYVEIAGDSYGISMRAGLGLRLRARRQAARARRVLEAQGFAVDIQSRRDHRQVEVDLVARRVRDADR